MKRLTAALLGLALCCTACKKTFQFSPHEVRPAAGERALNAKAIARIAALPPKNSFRFLLVGDTQRFYEQVDDFVAAANALDSIDFVLLAGDITDFGMQTEFSWVHERLSRLRVPYIAIIGNHDMLANGRTAFGQMYGPENFTFSYNGYKFVCLNTNSNETGFDGSLPEMSWFGRAMADLERYDGAFVVSHMAPYDELFDRRHHDAFTALVRQSGKVRGSLHGHQHRFSMQQPYNDGIPYVVVGSFNRRNYVLVTAGKETVNYEERYY
ncbi:metallophosphoesterase family protein [Flaviaesturariibacter amylovorans]|uniref:Metallophosphoesterase n=1 Tax=Flaviaesturariibacter amylovorans TaxID=1084520 RepID=A0ABP8G9J6_9BACT